MYGAEYYTSLKSDRVTQKAGLRVPGRQMLRKNEEILEDYFSKIPSMHFTGLTVQDHRP